MTRSVWTGIIVALLVLMLALLFPSGKTPASIGTQGIRIGLSSESGRPLHYPAGAGHLITIAPTRTGKGRDVLIPALLEWSGSCVVVDPKGELAAVTGNFRRRFGEVIVLNPFGIWPAYLAALANARYNPLAMLDPKLASFGADADKIAEGIIWQEAGEANHWVESARQLVSGIVMALVRHGREEEKNLRAVAQVISGGNVFGFCREAMKSPDPFIRQNLGRFAAPDAETNKELNSIVSTANTQLRFVGNEAIATSLGGSDIRFRDLKRRVITVYLVLPLQYLDVCGKWFRLVISSALADLLAEEKGVPVLMLIDEFFQLGSLRSIENAMGMAAGLGVTLWPILQDLAQLEGLFPKTWETFLSNALQMFFGPRDVKTSTYLSALCGQVERRVASKTIGRNMSVNVTPTARPLLDAYDARQMRGDEMILFIPGVKGVVRAKRRPYWEDFRGFGKNPYFG